jgi:hypothetical protein
MIYIFSSKAEAPKKKEKLMSKFLLRKKSKKTPPAIADTSSDNQGLDDNVSIYFRKRTLSHTLIRF